MTEANRELFSFFGAPQSQLDEAGGGAAEGLAQQLAALAGQAAQIGGSRGAAGVSCSGNDQQPAASSGLQSKISAARGSAADSSHLTHVDASGKAAMVDVSHKAATVRTATAGARVLLGRRVFDLVASNQLAKGDVLTVAQLAGVMGAKHTSALIPLCHNILLSRVHVDLALNAGAAAVDVTATATTVGPTGVEMEALTAAAVASLTVYDMCKAASKGVVVTDLRLLAKSGGKSGDWAAGDSSGQGS